MSDRLEKLSLILEEVIIKCTGDEYFYDTNRKEKQFNDKTAKKKIKRYYELHGYASLLIKLKN